MVSVGSKYYREFFIPYESMGVNVLQSFHVWTELAFRKKHFILKIDFFLVALLLGNTSQHFISYFKIQWIHVYFFMLKIEVLRWYLMGKDPLG